MKLTKIPLNKSNRMIRIGGGLHEGSAFFRVDLWFFGLRLTRS